MFYLHLSPPTPSTRCTSIQLLLCFCLISCNKYNRSTERLLCTSNQPARAQPRFIATSSQLPITDTIDIDQVLPWPLPGSLLMLLLLGGRCWWWTTTTTRQYQQNVRKKSISEVCRLGHTLNINTTIARIDDDGWMEGGELHWTSPASSCEAFSCCRWSFCRETVTRRGVLIWQWDKAKAAL